MLAALGSAWLLPILAAAEIGAVCTSRAYVAGPTQPPHNSGAQHTYKGLVPRSWTTRGLAAVTWTLTPGAATNPAAFAAGPMEAPTSFCMQLPVGHGAATWLGLQRYVCMLVCLHVFNFWDASFETFGLFSKTSTSDTKLQKNEKS